MAIKRSRLVTFRLSEAEYQQVKEMSKSLGVCNLSAFARLAMERVSDHGQILGNRGLEWRLSQLNEGIRAVHLALRHIGDAVDELRNPNRNADGQAGFARPERLES